MEGVEALQADAALHARLDLAHVLVKATQAVHTRLGDGLLTAQDAHQVRTADRALADDAAGHLAPADLKDLPHLRLADDYLLEYWLEEAFTGRFTTYNLRIKSD